MTATNFISDFNIIANSTDPIYIGTGGYTIGRVDNTIVRDPITRIPKIPGTSISGTWRYYMALELNGNFIENDSKKFRSARNSRNNKPIKELIIDSAKQWISNIEGNKFAGIKCAGQDDFPNFTVNEMQNNDKSGHCGQCIVCKSFGYSKKDKSEQGLVSFTDFNIIFFPVYTRFGTRWITTTAILNKLKNKCAINNAEKDYIIVHETDKSANEYLNLGWLNLPVKKEKHNIDISKISADLESEKIVIVSDELFAQIINSNLEVRTSVSIDPNTGAAKEGALFTSEAIPRATYFYGNIYIFDRFNSGIKTEDIQSALEDCKHYYETLGIGGMTTRGFGRMKIEFIDKNMITESSENEGDKK